ncbi:MAG: MEDS domain-containing protein [Pseudomonadota bacterium]
MFQPHDHVGFVCGQLWRWRQVVFPYLAQGLTRGERCVYLTTLHTPWLLESLLAWQGLDLGILKARRQLLILDASRYYLHRGDFEPDRLVEKNIAAVTEAQADGFTGLRAVADMSWAAYHPLEWGRLEEYEFLMNREVSPRYPTTALCIYDRQLFPPAMLEMVARTHPLLVDSQGQLGPAGPDSALP